MLTIGRSNHPELAWRDIDKAHLVAKRGDVMNSKDILLMVQSLSNEKGVSAEAIFQSD